jgi:hypothetical protein
MEYLASCMELEIISAKNIAILIEKGDLPDDEIIS